MTPKEARRSPWIGREWSRQSRRTSRGHTLSQVWKNFCTDTELMHDHTLDINRRNFVLFSVIFAGNLTTKAYQEDCEFADPAGSFRGLRRFKRNCTNFGSLLEKSNMKLTKWEDLDVSLDSIQRLCYDELSLLCVAVLYRSQQNH